MTANDRFTDSCNRMKRALDDGADQALIKAIAAELLQEPDTSVAAYRGSFDNVGAFLDQQTYVKDRTEPQSPPRS